MENHRSWRALLLISLVLMLAACSAGTGAPAGAVELVKKQQTDLYQQVQGFKITYATKMATSAVDASNGVTERWCLAGSLSMNTGFSWTPKSFFEMVEQATGNWRVGNDAAARADCEKATSPAKK